MKLLLLCINFVLWLFSEKMPLSIKLNFTLDKKKLMKDFNAKVKSNPDFNCLEIKNVKTYKEGSEFIIKNLYEQIISRENVFGIILKIVDHTKKFRFFFKTFIFVGISIKFGKSRDKNLLEISYNWRILFNFCWWRYCWCAVWLPYSRN